MYLFRYDLFIYDVFIQLWRTSRSWPVSYNLQRRMTITELWTEKLLQVTWRHVSSLHRHLSGDN